MNAKLKGDHLTYQQKRHRIRQNDWLALRALTNGNHSPAPDLKMARIPVGMIPNLCASQCHLELRPKCIGREHPRPIQEDRLRSLIVPTALGTQVDEEPWHSGACHALAEYAKLP